MGSEYYTAIPVDTVNGFGTSALTVNLDPDKLFSVPFDFPNYYPEDFKPCIPLHKYLEMDLKQSSAGELLKRIKPFDSEDMNGFFMDLEAGQS